uniref:Uncharacterized protein n=1 Tax=Chromera velia CCMP2878 TaxID=1169474 RepID=A0A0G4HJR0_9ALVE|eukprot:Cvel_7157.t1-p1 / transcript=Cvel_7157.t1 / gene=Cvel_7157 / organism=Chromera_velia_CCMP2878 / gene_product=Protein NLRC3, putative / transcript_product=Protein NLRC3, putative / location=Cvel_scaffold368:54731-56674(-) / protein_length=648 / sequence_SO=supercontig / SO=protein_coding / is_pseudo=false
MGLKDRGNKGKGKGHSAASASSVSTRAPPTPSAPLPPPIEEMLCILLEHARPTPQVLSDHINYRDSYGAAWLALRLIKKRRARLPFLFLNTSNCKHSTGKIYLLLDFLPASTEELILGRLSCRNSSLPRLCRLLKAQAKAKPEKGRGGSNGDRMVLKRLSFASRAITATEGKEIFPCLPPTLEGLNLSGNGVGLEGFRSLAYAVKMGRALALTALNLDKCGLRQDSTELLCTAFAQARARGTCPRLEILSLSGGLKGAPSDAAPLFKLLQTAGLPAETLREVYLSDNSWGDPHAVALAEVLGAGKLGALEHLDISQNAVGDPGLSAVASELRVESLPSLRSLDVRITETTPSGAEQLLAALSVSNQARPPVENLAMQVTGVGDNLARSICAGEYPFLKTLSLISTAAGEKRLLPFFDSVLHARSPLPIMSLALKIQGSSNESDNGNSNEELRVLAATLAAGRLSRCLQALTCWKVMGEGRLALIGALRLQHFPYVESLDFSWGSLTGVEMGSLSAGMKAGNFPKLKELNLKWNEHGEAGYAALMGAAVGGGLDELQVLNLSFSRVGPEGSPYLARALAKLPKMRELSMGMCGLQPEGMRNIAETLRDPGLPTLKSLDLRGNGLGDEGIITFTQALGPQSLPRLEVLSL